MTQWVIVTQDGPDRLKTPLVNGSESILVSQNSIRVKVTHLSG